jgi:ABC-type maltose transport system permease subunit
MAVIDAPLQTTWQQDLLASARRLSAGVVGGLATGALIGGVGGRLAMFVLRVTSDPSLQTLPVVQSIFQTQFSNNYNVSFASYLMAMAPAILVYVFTQRWVMSGVTQGAVKG